MSSALWRLFVVGSLVSLYLTFWTWRKSRGAVAESLCKQRYCLHRYWIHQQDKMTNGNVNATYVAENTCSE